MGDKDDWSIIAGGLPQQGWGPEMKTQPSLIRLGTNPVVVLLLVACVLSGVSGLLGNHSPTLQGLPPILHLIWDIGIMLGGVIGLVAVTGQRRQTKLTWVRLVTFLYIEQASMLLSGGLMAVYVGLIFSRTATFTSGVLVLAAFSIGFLWRALQIAVDTAEINRSLRDREFLKATNPTEDDPR